MLSIVPDLRILVFSITIVDLVLRSALVCFISLRASYLYNSTGIRFYIFCSEPALRICESPLSRVSALYRYYENTVLRFVWYCFVCVKYGYYRDLIYSWPASRLCYRHRHVWVRSIHTKKITVAWMSSLLFSIDLWRICYFVLFYFKLINGAIEKWWMVICCNSEIKNRTDHFLSRKY